MSDPLGKPLLVGTPRSPDARCRAASLVVSHSLAAVCGAALLYVSGLGRLRSPMDAGKGLFPPAPPAPRYSSRAGRDGAVDVAYLVFIRHGERSQNTSETGLTRDGAQRAEYLSRCVERSPSLAFPIGPPTRLLVSHRNMSNRPHDTVAPLARRLRLKIETADMMHIYAPLDVLRELTAGETLLVVWQHWFLPFLINALDLPHGGMKLTDFPDHCPSRHWNEPNYTRGPDGKGDCYGIMWQVALHRPVGDSDTPWQPVRIAQMQQGFNGRADSPCEEGVAPVVAQPWHGHDRDDARWA